MSVHVRFRSGVTVTFRLAARGQKGCGELGLWIASNAARWHCSICHPLTTTLLFLQPLLAEASLGWCSV
jgi:hypothetical protein